MNLSKGVNEQEVPVRPQQGNVRRPMGAQQVNSQQTMHQQAVNQQMNVQPQNGYTQPQMGAQGATYQQENYQQSNFGQQQTLNQNSKHSVNYTNSLDKTGAFKLNLMVYVTLGCLMFMCNLITPLVILFAVAFIMEKDNELTKVLATLIVLSLVISVGYNVVYDLTTPFSKLGYSIMEKASYGNLVYKFGDLISSGISSIRELLSWLVDIAYIVIGAIELNNIKKGKFKTPKFISKYFD